MQSNKIKLFIFDLDGVLTETSQHHFNAWRNLAKRFNVRLEDAFETHLKGVSRRESLNRILKAHHLDNQFTEEEINHLLDQKNKDYQSLIKNMDKEDLYPGVIQLFNHLKSKGINIALASASKNAPSILKALEITDYFDYIVNPMSLASKPAPDIFLKAMHHFDLSADQCIGIEDAYAGVSAINDAGMYSIGIGNPSELSHARICFPSIEAIPLTYIDRLIKGDSP